MENVADALKIAFGVLVFVTAITLLFIMIGHTRETADLTLTYADDTTYYAWTNSTEKNRIVTVADVITTIYRYYKESVAVTIKFKNGDVYVLNLKHKEDETETDIEEVEAKLADIVENHLIHESMTFTEKFTEVPTSGIYEVDEVTGSELTLSAGNRKIFITYEEIEI